MYEAIWLCIGVHVEEKKLENLDAESPEAYTLTLRNSDSICEVIGVKYLAHSTRCIVRAQYIWAIIIIVQSLKRSWGRARLTVFNWVSFLSHRQTPDECSPVGRSVLGYNPLSDGPWSTCTQHSSHPSEACSDQSEVASEQQRKSGFSVLTGTKGLRPRAVKDWRSTFDKHCYEGGKRKSFQF